jgi:spermidine synthase
VTRPLRVFLLAQCAIVGWAAAWAVALGWLPADGAVVQAVSSLFAEQQSYDQGHAWTTAGILKAYLVLPLLLYGLPTVLMGLSFTVLQQAVHDDVETSGRKVGLLQAANIAGCVAGSLLVGLVALSFWGTTGTLRLLALAGAVFAVVGLHEYGRRTWFTPAIVLLVVLAAAMPPQERLWARLHGVLDRPVWVDEDATGVIGLSSLGGNGWRMWVNGRPHSVLPFGGLHSVLGAAPAIVHPAPREVAVIGLGSGDTAWAAGCRGSDTAQVTVFEICAPERRLLVRLAATSEPPVKLREFLADPRMAMRLADGRNALQRDRRRYDVIEMDALHPSSPYSGNLYSEEFLRLCAGRLKPEGLLSTWAPTPRVLATVQKVFPYVLGLSGGQVLVASQQPIELSPLVWQTRLTRPDVQAYLGALPLESLENALAASRIMRDRRWRRTDYNSDLMPRDEFNAGDR